MKNPLLKCTFVTPYTRYHKDVATIFEKTGTFTLTAPPVKNLSADSEFAEIAGGSHIVMIEKPYYKKFRDAVINFLEK